MKLIYMIAFQIIFILQLTGQMWVHDPQEWWGEEAADIENVEIVLQTSGIYAEVQVAFDIKSGSDFYSWSDNPLEFVLDFKMDKDVVFNDSWLWIEDYISKGEVYAKGEGTEIYESIVDRQQDPSILTKVSAQHYNFKVYPLDPDSTRRVKLSYLTPLRFYGSSISADLDIDFLKYSNKKPEEMKLTIVDDENWFHDPLSVHSNWEFVEQIANNNEYVYVGEEPAGDYVIGYEAMSPFAEYYFGTYEDGGDKFYELVYFPKVEIESESKNHMLIFDYDHNFSGNNKEELIELTKNGMKQLKAGDYFNIIYSDFVNKFVADEWLPYNEANVQLACEKLTEELFASESKLISLLPEALNFIEEKGVDSDLTILSAGVSFNDVNAAVSFYEEVDTFLSSMDAQVNITIIDYAINKPSQWIEGQSYFGNEYFYSLLTNFNNAGFFNVNAGDHLGASLTTVFNENFFLIEQFKFDLELEAGFGFGEYYLGNGNDFVQLDKPIVSVGKYIGEGPFELEFEGIYNGQVFKNKIEFDEGENLELDPMASKAWHANYLLENEFNYESGNGQKVIETSKEQRLLCLQTVFLCLEENFMGISGENENDEELILAIEDWSENPSIQINAYPNPFTEVLNIQIPNSLDVTVGNWELEILSAEGSLIQRLNVNGSIKDEFLEFSWKPEQNIEAGLYVVRLKNEKSIYHAKVIYIR